MLSVTWYLSDLESSISLSLRIKWIANLKSFWYFGYWDVEKQNKSYCGVPWKILEFHFGVFRAVSFLTNKTSALRCSADLQRRPHLPCMRTLSRISLSLTISFCECFNENRLWPVFCMWRLHGQASQFQRTSSRKVREVWSGWFIRLCRCLMGERAGADIKGILRGPRGPKNAFDSLSVLTTLASNCYTFCGCNFCRLVTPWTPWQSVERHPMTPTLAAPTEDNGGIH